MKVKVTDQGVIVPKEFFNGVEEVEIREANGWIMMIPMPPIGKQVAELHPGAIEMSDDFDDPLDQFIGAIPSNIPDWTIQHDAYLGQSY